MMDCPRWTQLHKTHCCGHASLRSSFLPDDLSSGSTFPVLSNGSCRFDKQYWQQHLNFLAMSVKVGWWRFSGRRLSSVDLPSKPSFCTAPPTVPFQILAVGLKLRDVGTRSALRARATDYGIFERNRNSLYTPRTLYFEVVSQTPYFEAICPLDTLLRSCHPAISLWSKLSPHKRDNLLQGGVTLLRSRLSGAKCNCK